MDILKYYLTIVLITLFALNLRANTHDLSSVYTLEAEETNPTDPKKANCDSTKAHLDSIIYSENAISLDINENLRITDKIIVPIEKVEEKPTKNESADTSDDSVLTYNFLYYLLKLKFTEVIE